jgi:hypothetical protein
MEKIKVFQGQLLRYYKFGNSEEEAKRKVKVFSEDLKFLGIPIRENIDKLMEDTTAYTVLLQFSDLGFIAQIRDNCEIIKKRHLEFKDSNPIEKSEFASQYLSYLKEQFKSESLARERLKKLGEHMNAFGCPIGENLSGYVVESKRLSRLMACSSMGIMDKILEQVNNIKE